MAELGDQVELLLRGAKMESMDGDMRVRGAEPLTGALDDGSVSEARSGGFAIVLIQQVWLQTVKSAVWN